jgi:hypothetical protein
MPSLAEIAAPLALVLPVFGLAPLPVAPERPVSAVPSPGEIGQPAANAPEAAPAPEALPIRGSSLSSGSFTLDAFYQNLQRGQIRIEQRVVVRITPQRASDRRNLLAQLPVRAQPTQYRERKAERCVPLKKIAGVETGSGNRLILFMRDSDIMSLNLEKACRARDFYSGFYVEPHKDGKLCVDRDKLQSRNGARCDIERMMELVEDGD